MKGVSVFSIEVSRLTDNELQALISSLEGEVKRRKDACVKDARMQITRLLNQIFEAGYTVTFDNGCEAISYDVDTTISVE